MEPIFKNEAAPQHRLVLVLFFSVALIFFDHQLGTFDTFRGYLQSVVSPLQYIANTPKQIMTWASDNLMSRRLLIEENQQYKIEELKFKQQLQELTILKQENKRLRTLLTSPVRPNIKKMVAEIISVNNDPYSLQVVINRGTNDGVYEGQPIIDDQGIVGQILHVGTNSSRVLLITDLSHALPVRIQRNGVRLIATGSGRLDRLTHNFVPHSTDIHTGDLLVTSGLGGKFPEDYPVAKVLSVTQDESRPFAHVISEPVAQLDRLRYLLLLWPLKQHSIFSSKPTHKKVSKIVPKGNKKPFKKKSKQGSNNAL
ncbi:MAG: rod shape-determining protein MreC [Gammaproteobacteria bacterium]|nr:MAG: rod shape-determining protein MreC [Gammaproteobacteria bacterium]